MLEIKNVSKTYKPKKGVPVKALDDVSLSFGEKGLVFILGKSGSGKSTLLNVIGGLDKVDSGEFVINGKSSKSFSQGDFDAYRNTFIGFIFQEYNILNEFNVGQNIALAMELQGKKATKEALNKILNDVDLPGFALRKPNELSGGQKQRIAIARALIKDPKIIMADEPTGALDSNTGKQVFDTLKKLSKDKLVIVVSHDREFAEYYGDRVIELADGKIISDISKYEASPDVKSEHVNIIDNRIVHVTNGNELTDKDFEVIRQYIKNYKGDVLISLDERSNSSFKQIAMISDDGGKSSFKDTSKFEKETKSFKPEDSKFIRSKLPYKNALKIGANSIKTKPIRLFFTILLSFLSFAMFGLADTLASYNKVSTATQSILDLNIPYASLSINNRYETDYGDGDIYISTERVMGDNNTKKVLEEETNIKLFPVYSGINGVRFTSRLPSLATSSNSQNSYYYSGIYGVTEIGEEEVSSMGYSILYGNMPTSDDEIAITKYQFDVYNYYGFSPYNSIEVIGAGDVTYENIVNKSIQLNFHADYGIDALSDTPVKIVGIVDTKVDAKYDAIKEATDANSSITDYMLYQEFTSIITRGIHGTIFVNEGLIEKTISKNLGSAEGLSYLSYLKVKNYSNDSYSYGHEISHVLKQTQGSDNEIIWLNEESKTLTDKEIIIPANSLDQIKMSVIDVSRFYARTFYKNSIAPGSDDFETTNMSEYSSYDDYAFNSAYFNCLETNAIIEYVRANGVPESYKEKRASDGVNFSYESDWKKDYVSSMLDWDLDYGMSNYKDEVTLGANLSINSFIKFVTENEYVQLNDLVQLVDRSDRYGKFWDGEKVTVKGFFLTDGFYKNDESTIYVSDTFYDTLSQVTQNYYVGFIGVMPNNTSGVRRIVNYSYSGENTLGVFATLENQVMVSLDNINELIVSISKIFFYIGLGLAVFSGLLLANFIAVSIANKKKEIGILRAVGAKSKDVFTIFFNESLIIALINFTLALMGAIAGCIIFNRAFVQQIGLSITILSFGIRQVLLMLAISVGVALLASFFPVMAIARKQPIDSIHDK